MTWLSTNKAISLFIEGGVSFIGTRKFIIIFLFVIRFFLVPLWSWFVFYNVCFGRQSFDPCSNTLLSVGVFYDDVVVTFLCACATIVFIIIPRLRKLSISSSNTNSSGKAILSALISSNSLWYSFI